MRSFILLFIIPIINLAFGQVPSSNNQLKISYSMEYKKVPLQMKLFKKHLPKALVQYHSRFGLRSEILFNAKILGKQILSSTISVNNDSLSISWVQTQTTVNDSIIDNEFIESAYIVSEKNVLIGNKKKKILGYDCVNFVSENDSVKIEGFLAPEILVTGDFQKHGLPLEFKTITKKEKLIVITKAEQIQLEPLDKTLFILTEK